MATSPSDDEGRVDHKRMVHNEVERRRKVKINNWIYRLGDLLPGCSDDKKISKNGILERAVVYLKELQENNDKLLHGHCTEVQVAEFRRMKERIQELELRNSQLVRIVESSGVSVDLDALWQQHAKYSHKLEPESVAGLFSCKSKAEAVNPDKKAKALLPKQLDAPLPDCANRPTANSSEGGVFAVQPGTALQALAVSKQELMAENPSSRPVSITLQVNSKPAASHGTVECTAVCVAPNSSVTAVTQALSGVPIMSTSQHSSGSQQLLQQLPVLNYGNTVNIFPGLSGQSQPMIIINEQGIPLLQNLIPGQMILQPGSGQSMTLPNNTTTIQNSLIPAKQANNVVTVTNELNNGGNGALLLSTLQPTSALPTGIASSQIIVNAGIGQPLLPTTISGQNPGQLMQNPGQLMQNPGQLMQNPGQFMLNPTLSQPLFPSNVAATCPALGNSCPVVYSSSASTASCIQADALNACSAALQATNSQAVFQPSAVNAAAQILPTSGMAQKMESAQLANSLLGKGNLGNQVVFGCSSSGTLAPLQITVPHASTLIMHNGSRPVVQSPAPILTQETGLTTQLINQAACIPMQQNPVQLKPQPNVANGAQTVPVNQATGTSLPSALLLPNGQIIPVVSQPSLLYPASTPVSGNLLMTSSSPTAVFQTGGTNTQQFKPIISKEAIKGTTAQHGTLRQHTTTPIVCSSAHKVDMQPKSSSSILFPNQSDVCPSTTAVDVTTLKKPVRKCHRAIKPKPTSPAVERASETHQEELNVNTSDVQNTEEMAAVKPSEAAKSKAVEMARPAKPMYTPISSSAEPVSECFDHTTDILAKATESIFANSISEASPVTSLYGCETSTFCSHGNETTSSCERSATTKSAEGLESFNRADAGGSKDNVEVPSTDIFTDLENVYENAEKDMPTLEPVSPLGKVTSTASNASVGDDTRHEKHAPQLSLMITDHPATNELEVLPKRNDMLKPDLTPNKRQKLEEKLETTTCSKETANMPSTTQSLNFLSISQLTNNNFTMENNLCNDSSPLSSISPLLASPTKSLNSESFMHATQHPTSASSLMISPSVPEIAVPCSGSQEMANIMNTCSEGTVSKGNMERQENLVSSKAVTSASCPVKLPGKVTEHASSSVAVSASAEVGISSSSMFSPSRNSYTQSTAPIISTSEPSTMAQQSNSILHASCSTLAHFPPVHPPNRSSSTVQGIDVVASLNTQSNLYSTIVPMSSAEATELSHSLTTACSSGFHLGNSSPSAASLPIMGNTTSQQQQQQNTTAGNVNMTNTLQNHSFAMPDLIQVNNNKNHASFHNAVHQAPTIGHEGQCASEPAEITNDIISNVPSFNFGLFSQQTTGAPHQLAPQIPAQGMPRPFSQNFFQQGVSTAMPPHVNINSLAVGKTKNTPPAQRNEGTEAILQTNNNNVTPAQVHGSSHVRSGGCQPTNHSANAITSNHTLPNSDLPFPMHRVSSGASNYSAESLISQVAYGAQKQPVPQATSRPCLSYSAESLIQSQADRTPQCTPSGITHHHAVGVSSSVPSTSYANSANATSVPYSTASKRFNSTCSITNFHSSLNNKTPCTHMHQHGNMPFSFSLSQTNNQTTNVQQPHLAYPNMLPHYSSNFPARANKPSGTGQPPPVFRQENQDAGNGMHTQNCVGYAPPPNTFNPFSGTTERSSNGADAVASTAVLPDQGKLPQEKNKSKQENHVKCSTKPSKHSVQNKKKSYSVEEVNLSNSIFETNRSVTPYFTIPNLSPPRNEAPTYLSSNLFASQRPPPVGPATTQQNKTDLRTGYDPLFSSRSQTGLNLNFQAPTFGVNHIHSNAPNPVTNSNNVTNFNLSNIFPDINTTTENLSPMKFHSANSVLPNDVQHHQAGTALYNRPVLPNGMSINGFLAHNPHGFDSRPPPVAMPINNSVPPTFHGHSHTPTFSNVIPTLNFPMHEH